MTAAGPATKLPWDADLGPWYGIKEAAAMMGMSPSTLAKKCTAGIIKSGRLEDRPGVPHIFSARMIAEFNQRRKS